jgi:hypothetical protein
MGYELILLSRVLDDRLVHLLDRSHLLRSRRWKGIWHYYFGVVINICVFMVYGVFFICR